MDNLTQKLAATLRLAGITEDDLHEWAPTQTVAPAIAPEASPGTYLNSYRIALREPFTQIELPAEGTPEQWAQAIMAARK